MNDPSSLGGDPGSQSSAGPTTNEFRKGEKVNLDNFVGAVVTDPNPPGQPNKVQVMIPALPVPVFRLVPKDQLTPRPVSSGRPPQNIFPPVNLLTCCPWPLNNCCSCWSETLEFDPKRAVAKLFCGLNCVTLIYMFFAFLLIGSMGSVCALKYEVPIVAARFKSQHAYVDPKQTFSQSAGERAYDAGHDAGHDYHSKDASTHSYTTTEVLTPEQYASKYSGKNALPTNAQVISGSNVLPQAASMSGKHHAQRFLRDFKADMDDRSLLEDDLSSAPADTASGYATQEAEGYAKAEGDYKEEKVKPEYHAEKKSNYDAGQYKAHSAYVDMDAYSKVFVGPACNRLVVFLAVWSIIMLFMTLSFGCCMFRHWLHFSHTIGFWMAMLFFLAFDMLFIGIAFAIDAHNLHHQNHALYHRDPNWCAKHPKAGGCAEYNIVSVNHHRQLKASDNFLSWCFEMELCAAVMAFVLSYMYFIMGINTWRFSKDLIYDANKPRNTSVENKLSRLSGENHKDFRIREAKSLYFSKEYDHATPQWGGANGPSSNFDQNW